MRKQDVVREWCAENNINISYNRATKRGAVNIVRGEPAAILALFKREAMTKERRNMHTQRILREMNLTYDAAAFAHVLEVLARVVQAVNLADVPPALLKKAKFKAARVIRLAADDINPVGATEAEEPDE